MKRHLQINHPCHPLRMWLSRRRSMSAEWRQKVWLIILEKTVCRIKGHNPDPFMMWCNRCWIDTPEEI